MQILILMTVGIRFLMVMRTLSAFLLFTVMFPSPDVCFPSFAPPSSGPALCSPGCTDDVLYSVSVTNHFSSLVDEHDQSSDEGLPPRNNEQLKVIILYS